MASKYRSEIELKGDVKDIKRKLDEVNGKLKGLGDQAGKTSKRSVMAFSKLGVGIGALVTALGFAAKKAVSTSGEFEFLETRLTGLFGSVEAGRKAFDTFNEVASKTPFSLKAVVEAGSQLKAFGMDAERLIGTASDLAAFMGVDIVEAANSMGRAFAGGAGAADVLRDRGVLNLVKSFKGIDDLTKMTLPEFREAMEEAFTDSSVGIAGSSERLSKTWVGAVSNMMDALSRFADSVGDILIPILKPVVELISGAATAAENFIRSLTETELETTIRELKELGVATEAIMRLEKLDAELKLMEMKDSAKAVNSEFENTEDVLTAMNELEAEIAESSAQRIEDQSEVGGRLKEIRDLESSRANLADRLKETQAGGLEISKQERSLLIRRIGDLTQEIKGKKLHLDYSEQTVENTEKSQEAEIIRLKALKEELKTWTQIEEVERKIQTLEESLKSPPEEDKKAESKAGKTEKEKLAQIVLTEAFNTRQMELENQHYQASLDALDSYYDKQRSALIEAGFTEEEITNQQEQAKKELRQKYINDSLSASAQGFQNIQTMAQAFGKKGALLAKRAAQAEALVSAHTSAQKAYESGVKAPIPPPGNLIFAKVLAGLAYASGLGRVAQIEATKFAGGGIINEPVFSPLMKGGAIAGEAGREAIIPLDRKDGIFGQMNEEIKNLRQDIVGSSGVTVNISAPLVDETVVDSIIPAIEKAQRLDLA